MLSVNEIIARCNNLREFWRFRNEEAFPRWYKLIEMIDELKQDKMESFVGNDPRSMFNLFLHLLDQKVPHRLENVDLYDYKVAEEASKVSNMLDFAWSENNNTFRRSGPRQSLSRYLLSMLLATGWYSMFAIVADNGRFTFMEPWNPAEVYPMWDFDMGLSEVLHEYTVSSMVATRLAKRNGWELKSKLTGNVKITDYWWVDYDSMYLTIWNAVLYDNKLVKNSITRFDKIPIYVGPVAGLPDTGTISVKVNRDQWKAEIGQSVVAVNENVYRAMNKWFTFAMQILRDIAQPITIEKSTVGKAIVKAEDLFRRGSILRMGPQDDVKYLEKPPIPLELRTTQADLEAMAQRGGPSFGMFGDLQGNITAYVMSQIAASANQIIKPFLQGYINLISDIDTDIVKDCQGRGVRPYGLPLPDSLPERARITAEYEVEIPGELIQKVTVSRMMNPDFALSYTYVMDKLWRDVKDPMRERARYRKDQAERDPRNATIAYIQYCEEQAAVADQNNDYNTAKLYRAVAESAKAELQISQGKRAGGAANISTSEIRPGPQAISPEGPGSEVSTPV